VVLVAPAWVSYPSQVTLAGKRSIVIQTTYEDGWKLTPHSLTQVNMLEYWLTCCIVTMRYGAVFNELKVY